MKPLFSKILSFERGQRQLRIQTRRLARHELPAGWILHPDVQRGQDHRGSLPVRGRAQCDLHPRRCSAAIHTNRHAAEVDSLDLFLAVHDGVDGFLLILELPG